MMDLERGDQRRAVAAQIIKRAADALTDDTIVEEWVIQYRRKIPINEIAASTLKKHSECFPSLDILMLSGVIRTKIRAIVPVDERKEVEFHHRSTGQSATYAQGRSSALTLEAAQTGGSRSGSLHVEKGTGIFGLSEAQKRENAIAGGVASHIAKGHIPWSPPNQASNGMSEHELCMHLPTLAQFQHKEGRTKGKPNNQAIADELNRIFHEGRLVRKASHVNVRRSMHKNA